MKTEINRRNTLALTGAGVAAALVPATATSNDKVSSELQNLIASFHAADKELNAACHRQDVLDIDWRENKPFIVAQVANAKFEIDKCDARKAIREQHIRLLPAHNLPDELKNPVKKYAWQQARQWYRNWKAAEQQLEAAREKHGVAGAVRETNRIALAFEDAIDAILRFPARTNADRKAWVSIVRQFHEEGFLDDYHIGQMLIGMEA